MSQEVYQILDKNAVISGTPAEPLAARDNECFLRSKKCLNLNWPLNLREEFFRQSDEPQTPNRVSIYFCVLPSPPSSFTSSNGTPQPQSAHSQSQSQTLSFAIATLSFTLGSIAILPRVLRQPLSKQYCILHLNTHMEFRSNVDILDIVSTGNGYYGMSSLSLLEMVSDGDVFINVIMTIFITCLPQFSSSIVVKSRWNGRDRAVKSCRGSLARRRTYSGHGSSCGAIAAIPGAQIVENRGGSGRDLVPLLRHHRVRTSDSPSLFSVHPLLCSTLPLFYLF
ncbi:hypothetical protein RJT34_19721 [Clitoria ternatea]|uniref:Uncharacterized protein n=1 Tax=Clitoria ternatea TaxID=43366 RepID=A0AAN9IRJ2_CLITE